MPEPASQPGQEPAPAIPPGQEPSAPTTFSREYVEQLRQEAAAHRTRAQALEAAQQEAETARQAAAAAALVEQGKFKELYEAEQQARAQEAARATAAEHAALITRIAAEVGLPPALASRLQGADEAAIRADAASLAALLPKAPYSGPPTNGTRPAPGGTAAPQYTYTTLPSWSDLYSKSDQD